MTARLSALVLMAQPLVPAIAQAQDNSNNTKTPIKHVIVIIGENRTFDHVFATYKPKSGESVDNLLSRDIINDDGTPGPNYFLASEFSAVDTHAEKYQISPADRTLYPTLPTPPSRVDIRLHRFHPLPQPGKYKSACPPPTTSSLPRVEPDCPRAFQILAYST